MIDLKKIQDEISLWVTTNNLVPEGVQGSWKPLLGIGEEVGELNHAYLKRRQAIRGTTEEHTAAIEDAVGDLAIFLMSFCQLEGIEFEEVLRDTWAKVQERNWLEDPQKGGTE
jgi:NTP pyrophosphatase (non-canonical NTP hydrolase)